MFAGFPVATSPITSVSSSMPTAVDDGGGVNLGGTADGERASRENEGEILIKIVNNRYHHADDDDAAK